MAFLQRKLFNPKTMVAMVQLRRRMGHDVSPKPWNYLWKPGPYPKTEEERIKAAKKYGLIPEDYKPFPEDEMNGDYPDLKPSSADSRSGNEYWDAPEFRRNYNEPLHIDFDCQQETRFDDTTRFRYTLPQFVLSFVCTFLAFLTPVLICWNTPVGVPMTIPQMPRRADPHVYYTFEPADK